MCVCVCVWWIAVGWTLPSPPTVSVCMGTLWNAAGVGNPQRGGAVHVRIHTHTKLISLYNLCLIRMCYPSAFLPLTSWSVVLCGPAVEAMLLTLLLNLLIGTLLWRCCFEVKAWVFTTFLAMVGYICWGNPMAHHQLKSLWNETFKYSSCIRMFWCIYIGLSGYTQCRYLWIN